MRPQCGVIELNEALGLEHRRKDADGGLDELADVIVEAGRKVHKTLGRGLLESIYEHSLAHELQARDVAFVRQPAPPAHDGPAHAYGYRLDFVVADVIVVEIGAVDAPACLHEPEVLEKLRRSGYLLGLLLDFNAERYSEGVKRFVL